MKKIIPLLLLSAMLSAPLLAFGSFCKGFNIGYTEGYCYNEFSCVRPVPKPCPVPRPGEFDFIAGYNRGFMEGFIERRK